MDRFVMAMVRRRSSSHYWPCQKKKVQRKVGLTVASALLLSEEVTLLLSEEGFSINSHFSL